jgi:hypothetical protein
MQHAIFNMKLYTNDPLVSRKQRIGFWFTLIGVACMVGAIFVSQTPENVIIAWLISLAGLTSALFGTYHINRWARRPVSHQSIGQALEKLDSRHLLMNHVGVVPHILLTPKGIIGIRVKRYEGPVQYSAETQKWQGKFSLGRLYMQGMTAENLGNPTADAQASTETIKAWLAANNLNDVPVTTIAYFVAPRVIFSGDPAPIPLAQPETLRKSVQEQFADLPLLSHDSYDRVRQLMEEQAETKNLSAATPEKRVRAKGRNSSASEKPVRVKSKSRKKA